MIMKNIKINKEFGIDNIKDSFSCIFNDHTKLNHISLKEFERKISDFSMSRNKLRSMLPFKVYPKAFSISLESGSGMNQPDIGLVESIKRRRSIRTFKKFKVSLQEVSYLLQYSYGITKTIRVNVGGEHIDVGLRSVPSGGALYPLEIYVAIYGGDFKDGFYHYRADNNTIEYICDIIPKEDLSRIINADPVVEIKNVSMIFFVTSILERYILKYGDRGYKFMLQETGFVMGNLSLLSVSLGLGTCLLGGFLDEEVNRLLGIDGLFETINSVLVIGKE